MPAPKNPYAKPDRFTRAAKDAGFPARSVFKLEEIDRRTRLLRPAMRVLDLGASPGSWSMYAAQRIGSSGKLLAIDLEPLRVALPPHAVVLQGDAFSKAVLDGGEIPVTLEDAIANMSVIEAIFRSAETGAWIAPEQ